MPAPILTGFLDNIIVNPLVPYNLFENSHIFDNDLLDLVGLKIKLSDPTAGSLILPDTGGLLGGVIDIVNGLLSVPLGSPLSLTNVLQDIVYVPNNPADVGDLVNSLLVTVTDLLGNTVTKVVNILPPIAPPIVGNVGPTDLALSDGTVFENAATNAIVGVLTTTDANLIDTFTYSLVDNAGGRFKIVNNQLQVANGSLIDFEANTSHDVKVKVTDSGGETFEKIFTVTVVNIVDEIGNAVPQAPTNVALTASVAKEGAAVGVIVGQLETTDPNIGDVATYQLLDNAGGRFILDGSVIRVANGVTLDFEQAAVHQVIVRATDATNNSLDKIININVGNVLDEVLSGTGAGDVLFGGEFTDQFNGLGGNDVLKGGGGNDVLFGGLGADRLEGQSGNDLIYTDGSDTIIETSTGGTDTIYTTANLTLRSNLFVERLIAQDSGSKTSLKLIGNQIANKVVGNAGNNSLDGAAGNDILSGGVGNDKILGGIGNDALQGGAGRDTFVFNSSLSSKNTDRVLDFKPTDDVIQLENAVFKGLKGGALSTDAFHVGTAAEDAEDRIIYNSSNGNVFFDRDGTGSAAAVKFANVKSSSALTHSDFVII